MILKKEYKVGEVLCFDASLAYQLGKVKSNKICITFSEQGQEYLSDQLMKSSNFWSVEFFFINRNIERNEMPWHKTPNFAVVRDKINSIDSMKY